MKKLYLTLLTVAVALGASAAPQRAKLAKAHHRAAMAAPVVRPATNVTLNSFTANWDAYAGAETYTLRVYCPVEVTRDGEYAVISEDFNTQPNGTFAEPYDDGTTYLTFDDTDWVTTPGWIGFYPVLAKGMVGGVIYTPTMDLTADGGKFTVHMTVTGYGGGIVRLTSYGDTKEVKSFELTQTGANEINATFTNGTHDTYLCFVDDGIPNDTEGLYTDCYDYLDDFTVTQEFKAGDKVLVPVAEVEPETNHYDFDAAGNLRFAWGNKKLAYDVQANIVTWGDPDDPWDYDVEWTPYSALEYVTLQNPTQGGGDPVDPNPGVDPKPDDPIVDPEITEGVINVGSFDKPTAEERRWGAGSWWEQAPYQFYTVYSGGQFIYTAENLEGLKPGDKISEISFKYGDDGSFAWVNADLQLFIENIDEDQFRLKTGSDDTYLWFDYDASTSKAAKNYDIELYYMEDEVITFVLDEPLEYEGKNLLVTTFAERTSDEEAQAMVTYGHRTEKYNAMVIGSDLYSFPDFYDSTEMAPYQGPNKYVPLTQLAFTRPSREDGIGAVEADTAAPVEYFNLQGVRVDNPADGLYIRRQGTRTSKVLIK